MKIKTLVSTSLALFALFPISASSALAEEHPQIHFAGVLNDYTPVDPLINGSPYEMHGQWSVDVNGRGRGDFYADMTMSDYATPTASWMGPKADRMPTPTTSG